MGSASLRLLGVCAVLMAIAVANAASGEAASVVVGLAKCADCTRKNMKAEAAFKGLKVAIKCKDTDGEYKNKALGELQSSGAFSVLLSVDLHGADCLAQLQNAAGTPCPGQEPSRITPLADGSFVAIPGNMQQPSAVCASVTICGPMKKHLKPEKPKPKPEQPKTKSEPEPKPEQPKPKPELKPAPEHQPPSPSYGSQTPIYHPPAMHLTDNFHKDDHDELHHFFDHFHKKPVPPKPEPQPKPQPENHPPTPAQGSPTTPTSGSPTTSSHHFFDHFHKGHGHHHFFDHFHKKPVPPQPKPEPKPQPTPQPGNQAPTPSNGSPTPIYSPPSKY